jgi:riboflavin biosynthesis pyrimidine reductase
MNENELEEQIHLLYGEVDWLRARGILHVMAIIGQGDSVIAMGPTAPRSATDRFILGLARARSELVLTSGAILRSEANLEHRYAEDAETNASFVRWRRKTLGLEEAPALLIISKSGELPNDHPALHFARAGMVWTSKVGRERLGPSLGRLSVEAGITGRGDAEPAKLAETLGGLLRTARSRFRARTILIEAGPGISTEFYRSPQVGCPRLNELLLSRFEGNIEAAAIGPSFESISGIREFFPEAPRRLRVEEPSGAWVFERYRDVASESDGK